MTSIASMATVSASAAAHEPAIPVAAADVDKQLREWRHKCKLLENERVEYEKAIQQKYKIEKEAVEMELQVLKKLHIDKVQAMSTSMAQLQKQVERLRLQLKKNAIDEDIDLDEKNEREWLLESWKEEADFIKAAYQQAMHDYTFSSSSEPTWASIHDHLAVLQHQLIQQKPCKTAMDPPEKREDRGLKKSIFGKAHRRKSAMLKD
ncbi:hypothetical protein BC940DRAFT_304281 [Gongronella butleri]|nr:hypothetical protein BC940DRAFT_304281 [Gongronella butleri]